MHPEDYGSNEAIDQAARRRREKWVRDRKRTERHRQERIEAERIRPEPDTTAEAVLWYRAALRRLQGLLGASVENGTIIHAPDARTWP
jgi:hypothetical protein